MWEILKNNKTTGIIETNLAQAWKYCVERANTYDSESEKYHTYGLLPVLCEASVYPHKTRYKPVPGANVISCKRR